MRTHFNLSAAEYESSRHGAVEQRRHLLVRQTIDSLPPGVKNAVELGCGPGKFLADLADDYPALEFLGIDINPAMIEHASQRHQRPNLRYEVRNIIGDGGSPAQFAFSIDVLHHIHHLDEFFRAVVRLLSPEGVWLAIEPNIFHPYIYYSQERMRRAGFDEDHFRPWITEPLMRDAGFVIESRSYASLFPGAVRRLPQFLGRFERLCENHRFLGGSVVYRLRGQTLSDTAI